MTEQPKGPLGGKIRDFMNSAIDDGRRAEIQYEFLDALFGKIAERLDIELEKRFSAFFNRVAQGSAYQPEEKTKLILSDITHINPQTMEPIYSPTLRIPLLATTHAQFEASEIRDLPNFIRMHEKARDLDVALRITGLPPEEARGLLMLHVDAFKTYEEGMDEPGGLYPDLPPKPEPFDKDKGQDLDF